MQQFGELGRAGRRWRPGSGGNTVTVRNVSGNGFKDTFNGINFTWHAATVTGAAAPAPSTPASNGGYHY